MINESKVLTISLKDFFFLNGKTPNDFIVKGVRYSLSERIRSGANLPSIRNIERRAMEGFLRELPNGTIAVVSVNKVIQETPSGFLSEGRQIVSYMGTALVAK